MSRDCTDAGHLPVMNSPPQQGVSNTLLVMTKISKRTSRRVAQRQPPVESKRGRVQGLATGAVLASTPAAFSAVGTTVRIARREMVGTLTASSTNFEYLGVSNQENGYDLSPTTGALFPWVSQIATAFERFRFRRLRFEVVSGNPATSAGRLYIAADPDWDDSVPTTVSQLMGLRAARSSSVWESLSLDIPIVEFGGDVWRYCSPFVRGTQGEPRTSFIGFFMAACSGAPANSTFDLWVDYEVELTCPTSENYLPEVATFAGGNVAATSLVAGTSGRLYWEPTLPQGKGMLKVVDASSVGLAPVTADGVYANSAIVLPTTTRGFLQSDLTYSRAGVTPTAAMAADVPSHLLNIFDAAGTRLGDIGSCANKIQVVGPASASSNGAGAALISSVGAYLKDIFSLYPTAKYAVPSSSFVAGLAGTLSALTEIASIVL